MACESSQDAMSPRSVSLSDLPEAIIHHIFSFMEPNYTTKVCTLSKRFHHLCKTSPYLNFLCKSWPQQFPLKNFIRFVRRYFEQRGGLKVQRVRFAWHSDRREHHPLLHELLIIILEYNVQEIFLHLEHYGSTSTDTYFPPSLFQSQHLKVLDLYCRDKRLSLQHVKLNNCLQVLTLHLEEVDNSVAEWISNSCPFLKCLTINQNILHLSTPEDGIFIIKSSSLEELRISGFKHKHVRVTANKLQSLHIMHQVQYRENYVFVEINAPNIQSLTWVGGARLKFRFTRGLKMLKKAIIDVWPNVLFGQVRDASLCLSLLEFLQDLQEVRSLHLSSMLIQFLAENNCIPTGLGNARHLSLFMWDTMTSSFVSSVARFLKELKNVEVLHIRKPPRSYLENCMNDDDEKLKLLRYLMPFQTLKEFAIYPK